GLLFLLAVLIAAGLSFYMIFLLIMYAELEEDYHYRKHNQRRGHAKMLIQDRCNTFNQFVLPEIAAHTFLVTLFIISGQWSAFLLNVPLVAYNGKKIRNKTHMYDPTKLHKNPSGYFKETCIKFGFYLVSFFYYLYWCVAYLLGGGPCSSLAQYDRRTRR
ncbi:cornichon, partial [Mycena epipterygia]